MYTVLEKVLTFTLFLIEAIDCFTLKEKEK